MRAQVYSGTTINLLSEQNLEDYETIASISVVFSLLSPSRKRSAWIDPFVQSGELIILKRTDPIRRSSVFTNSGSKPG